MKCHHLSFAVFLILSAPAAVALAGDPLPPRGPLPFAAYDLDGDGNISASEFEEVRAERARLRAAEGFMGRNQGDAPAFGDIDADGNGRIGPQEYMLHQQQRQQMRMQGGAGGMGRGGRP